LAWAAGCQGGASRVPAEDRAAWELLDVATTNFKENRTGEEFQEDLVKWAQRGGRDEIGAVLKLSARGDGCMSEYYEDMVIALLAAVGDDRFCDVLASDCDEETQSWVVSDLGNYVWNLDNEVVWKMEKQIPDRRYPRTWRFVVDRVEEWEKRQP